MPMTWFFLSPTIQGLQFLIDEIYFDFNRLGLEVNNTNKTVFFRVFHFKCLCIILNCNSNDSLDIERSTGSLNRSFVFLFRKFNSVSIEIFYKLFSIYCTSFYGSELWLDRSKCKYNFNKAAVSYHYVFKKILGVPKYFSNYFICDIFSILTYEHFINFKCIRFLFWLDNCNSSCFSAFQYYFRNITLLQCFDDLVLI